MQNLQIEMIVSQYVRYQRPGHSDHQALCTEKSISSHANTNILLFKLWLFRGLLTVIPFCQRWTRVSFILIQGIRLSWMSNIAADKHMGSPNKTCMYGVQELAEIDKYVYGLGKVYILNCTIKWDYLILLEHKDAEEGTRSSQSKSDSRWHCRPLSHRIWIDL